MFENLSDRLERSFKILKGEGKITEINVAETLKDVRRALLDADVNYKVAKTFTDTVKQKALGMNVLNAVKPGQLMVKLVHDELAELMGGEAAELKLEGRPAIILMSGLQGSGKTTFSGKLANMLKNKQHKNPLLVACDVYRPAAIEQLKVVGTLVGVPVYSEPDNKNVVEIAGNAIKEAKAKGHDVVIIDTAGRLAVDEEMMNEIETLKNAVNPSETLFVVDSMTGQDAVNQGIQRKARLRRRCTDKTRRRHTRRCRAEYTHGCNKADKVCRYWRKDGGNRRVPPLANGRPHIGNGRHCEPRGACTGTI